MITTTLLATTLESVPANAAAASSVGADNIDIDAEIATAARRAAKGTYAHHLGVDSELSLDPSKLIPKVCAVIKSKRGMNENKLPEDLHKQICDKVFSFVTGVFKDKIQPHANLTYKKTPIFRKNHEVSPVALRHTYSSIQEIGFKEQRLLLNTRVSEARRKLEQALESNIADRITKWTKALDTAEQMLATLDNSEAIASGKQ
jgi:hypothetical protein